MKLCYWILLLEIYRNFYVGQLHRKMFTERQDICIAVFSSVDVHTCFSKQSSDDQIAVSLTPVRFASRLLGSVKPKADDLDTVHILNALTQYLRAAAKFARFSASVSLHAFVSASSKPLSPAFFPGAPTSALRPSGSDMPVPAIPIFPVRPTSIVGRWPRMTNRVRVGHFYSSSLAVQGQ